MALPVMEVIGVIVRIDAADVVDKCVTRTLHPLPHGPLPLLPSPLQWHNQAHPHRRLAVPETSKIATHSWRVGVPRVNRTAKVLATNSGFRMVLSQDVRLVTNPAAWIQSAVVMECKPVKVECAS